MSIQNLVKSHSSCLYCSAVGREIKSASVQRLQKQATNATVVGIAFSFAFCVGRTPCVVRARGSKATNETMKGSCSTSRLMIFAWTKTSNDLKCHNRRRNGTPRQADHSGVENTSGAGCLDSWPKIRVVERGSKNHELKSPKFFLGF